MNESTALETIKKTRTALSSHMPASLLTMLLSVCKMALKIITPPDIESAKKRGEKLLRKDLENLLSIQEDVVDSLRSAEQLGEDGSAKALHNFNSFLNTRLAIIRGAL